MDDYQESPLTLSIPSMSFVISSSRAISRIENPTLCTISQPYNKNLLLKVNPQPGNRGNQEILFSWRLRIGIITGRNEVMAKVMFLLVSVILLTGGVSASVHAGIPHPPWEQTPPREQTSPGADTPRADTPHPWEQTPPRSRVRHTVNERPVRILLECILVWFWVFAERRTI